MVSISDNEYQSYGGEDFASYKGATRNIEYENKDTGERYVQDVYSLEYWNYYALNRVYNSISAIFDDIKWQKLTYGEVSIDPKLVARVLQSSIDKERAEKGEVPPILTEIRESLLADPVYARAFAGEKEHGTRDRLKAKAAELIRLEQKREAMKGLIPEQEIYNPSAHGAE